MSKFQVSSIRPTNYFSRDEEIGPYIRDGQLAVLDVELPWFFKYIYRTAAGTVVFENQAGKAVTIPDVQPYILIPAIGKRILTGTAAGDVWVYTGE